MSIYIFKDLKGYCLYSPVSAKEIVELLPLESLTVGSHYISLDKALEMIYSATLREVQSYIMESSYKHFHSKIIESLSL